MHHLSARKKLAEQPLSGTLIHKEMSRLFPKRNDYGAAPFDELVPELARFGVNTVARFRALVKKHRKRLIAIDREALYPWGIRLFSEMSGEEEVKDALRRQYWFAYPALVRTAAELEFGEEAAVYEAELQQTA